jgi:lambda repressor-like predicted transcriptional regulator
MLHVPVDELEKRCGALTFARLFKAYLGLSESHQKALRRVIEVVTDERADLDERERALDAIVDALSPPTLPFPECPNDRDGGVDVRAEMDDEEVTFAGRLRGLLAAKKLTQAELAKEIGVRQSTISMMVNRACRPRRSTVEKIALALGVTPEELWPGTRSRKQKAV